MTNCAFLISFERLTFVKFTHRTNRAARPVSDIKIQVSPFYELELSREVDVLRSWYQSDRVSELVLS